MTECVDSGLPTEPRHDLAPANEGEFEGNYFSSPDACSAYAGRDYVEAALLSRLYIEMAETIATVFAPRKVLEVGCAAGPVIMYLNNFFGIEAVGVDVSDWAVEHRLHPNVVKGNVASLPFDSGEFDFVFSSHAIEHCHAIQIDRAIAEMTRVSTPYGTQMHLLPLLGSTSYPDIFGAIVQLRRDPTHRLLFDRGWWLDRFGRCGWRESGVQVAFTFDNVLFEISQCQLLMTRAGLSSEVLQRVGMKNMATAGAFHAALNGRAPPGL